MAAHRTRPGELLGRDDDGIGSGGAPDPLRASAIASCDAVEFGDDHRPDPLGDAGGAQHFGTDARPLAHDAQEDVLRADVVVPELQRLAQRQLEHLLRPGGERDVPGRCSVAASDDPFDLAAAALEIEPEVEEHPPGDRLRLTQQTEEDVFRTDVGVTQTPGLLLGDDDGVAGSGSEALEHVAIIAPVSIPSH